MYFDIISLYTIVQYFRVMYFFLNKLVILTMIN